MAREARGGGGEERWRGTARVRGAAPPPAHPRAPSTTPGIDFRRAGGVVHHVDTANWLSAGLSAAPGESLSVLACNSWDFDAPDEPFTAPTMPAGALVPTVGAGARVRVDVVRCGRVSALHAYVPPGAGLLPLIVGHVAEGRVHCVGAIACVSSRTSRLTRPRVHWECLARLCLRRGANR